MRTRIQRLIACFIILQAAAWRAEAQVVHIQFAAEVRSVLGTTFAGVTNGSMITGEVTVDLAHLPADADSDPHNGLYQFEDRPGYIFQFSAGAQTVTYYSTNVGEGGGLIPGLFLYRLNGSDLFVIQARDADNPAEASIQFLDITEPLTLLKGDHFPEDLNLSVGLPPAVFHYSGTVGNQITAWLTTATLTIDPAPTRLSALISHVNGSSLPLRRKGILLRILRAADRAYADDRCRLAHRHLRNFQRNVRIRVQRADRVLAAALRAEAQSIVDAGCGAEPGISVY